MARERPLDSPISSDAPGFAGAATHELASGLSLISNRRLFSDLVTVALQAAHRDVGPVVLVDGELDPADERGLGQLARLREQGNSVAVIDSPSDPLVVAVWIEAGANAVLTRESSLVELLDVVERLSAGETVIGVAVREGLLSQLRTHRQVRAEQDQVFHSLTKREREVLTALSFGASPEDIARTSFVSMNTVRTQIRNVLGKLGVASVAAAVSMAHCSRWFDGSARKGDRPDARGV